jgi:hypothetical protein
MAQIKGGEALQKALRQIAENLKNGATVRVGFLSGATYARLGKKGADFSGGKSVAMIAAIQNFGAPARGIPPRPFFSNMVKDKSPSWPKAIELNLRQTNYDAKLTMERMGAGIKRQLQQSIIDMNSPPLSAKTIKRKGFAKPLVDSGHMLNSVDYEVDG